MNLRTIVIVAASALFTGTLTSGWFGIPFDTSEQARVTLALVSLVLMIAVGVSYLISQPGYVPDVRDQHGVPIVGGFASAKHGVTSTTVSANTVEPPSETHGADLPDDGGSNPDGTH